MVKRLLFLALWLVFAAALHLFGNNIGTFVILLSSVIIPALSGAALIVISRLPLAPELILPELRPKGEGISGFVAIKRGRPTSLFKISCRLACENRFTGESTVQALHLGKAKSGFALKATHCGVLQICAKDFTIADPLGLFVRRLKHSPERLAYVPPVGFETEIALAMNIDAQTDSAEYSMTQPGMDTGEIFGIREYLPGDPIRSIHWKLTEKLDKVMVREFGLPIQKSVLLLFKGAGDAHISPDQWDAAAELFFSAALAVLKNGIPASMGRFTQDGSLATYELNMPEDAAEAMRQCLSSTLGNGALTPEQRAAYEHIIVVEPGGKIWRVEYGL